MPILASDTKPVLMIQCDTFENGAFCNAKIEPSGESGQPVFPFMLRMEAMIDGWQPLNPMLFDDHTLICSGCVRERLKKERRNERDRKKREAAKARSTS